MKEYKNIDIKTLKPSERKLLLEYLKIHFFYKHIRDIRLEFREQIEKTFTNLKINEDFKIIDNNNKISTLFQWRECDYKDNGEFINIIPKPFIIDERKVKFPQKNSFIDIYKTLDIE